MRTITLRQLSEHLFTELKDLPLEVTRYGKPYVVIERADTMIGIDLETGKPVNITSNNELIGGHLENNTEVDLSKEYNQ